MDKFQIGEIVIGQGFTYNPERNGMECEIIEGVLIRRVRWKGGREGEELTYLVKWPDGELTAQEPHQLRKKKHPQDLSSWEAVQEQTGWSPQKVGMPSKSATIEP